MRFFTPLRTALATRAALAVSVVGAPGLAFAEETGRPMELAAVAVEEVTVTATRSEKPVDQAPATVDVISSRRIEEELATDIKDLIRFEAGVSVRSSPSRFTAAGASTGRDGNSGFNIRGLEGNRVLILTDGVRVPDAYSFGAQALGRGDYVDLDVLRSVEILRGPASALYGGDGVAGAVSFVTKDPVDVLSDKAWSLQARAAYASADESWAKGVVGAGRHADWSAMVAYTRRDAHEQQTRGEDESANVNRTAANPQDIFSNALLAKLVFEPDDRHRVRLTYDHLDRKIESDVLSAIAAPPLAATSAIGLIASDSVRRDRVSLDHLYRGDGFIREARWTAYWQQAKTNQYSNEDRNTAPDRTRIGVFDTRVMGAALQIESLVDALGVNHRLIYGGDYSSTRQTGLRDGTIPPRARPSPPRPSRTPTTSWPAPSCRTR